MIQHRQQPGLVTDALDFRPVAHALGRIIVVLALLMVPPAILDHASGSDNAEAFLLSLFLTGITGILISLSTQGSGGQQLTIRQAYLLTFLIWSILPLFGALPLVLGAPNLRLVDAYFESVSGLTSTGATVIYGLDSLPPGVNLWRGLLNWTGGLGIVFVAMIFLPAMRVGGMQMFRAEGFDTFGKVLPRASDIAKALTQIYLALTAACVVTFLAVGMTPLDAVVNGFAAVSTGGFSASDASVGKYPGLAEYAAVFFMCAASLPFVRYIQLVRGEARPILGDAQVRFFLSTLVLAVMAVTAWAVIDQGRPLGATLRETLFNLTSIATGTGFFSGTFSEWEGLALVLAFAIGMFGGCSGSTSGAMSSFRVLLTARILAARVRQIQSPSRIIPIRYEGKNVGPDVVESLMVFMTAFIFGLGLIAVGLTLTGVDSYSAVVAAWATLGNIGYGFGPLVALGQGTFQLFPDSAKWIMALSMLLGRLGLLSIFVLVLPEFWRR